MKTISYKPLIKTEENVKNKVINLFIFVKIFYEKNLI